jgi:aspartate racemase
MYSVDLAEVETLQHEGRWGEAARLMIAAARSVEQGGADFVVICTNTMHRVADAVEEHIRIPLLHIADATAEKIKAHRLRTVGLLGTKFTMEENFYKGRLSEKHGLQVIIPSAAEREIVHRVIYDELCLGEARESSRGQYVEIMSGLVEEGAEGIVLGCTEIGLLVRGQDSPVPVFDTTRIHALAAAEYALGS